MYSMQYVNICICCPYIFYICIQYLVCMLYIYIYIFIPQMQNPPTNPPDPAEKCQLLCSERGVVAGPPESCRLRMLESNGRYRWDIF